MEQILLSLLLLLVLFVFLGTGIWVAVSLLGVGLVGMVFFTTAPAGAIMATTI